ncbi:MAG: glycosyltransferase [Gammaproteobacteria bacterium]|nr:glycosyltransferase [Gammaproteobacteria bacterium]
MRICHVIECGATGAFEMVLLMSDVQHADGHQVLIIYSPRPGTPADLKTRVNPAVHLVCLPMRPVLMRAAVWCWRYFMLLRKWNPEVIHFHGARAGFLGRLLAGWRWSGHALYSPHCISLMHLNRSKLEHALFRCMERFANRICRSLYVACCSYEHTVIEKEVGVAVALLENAVEDGLINPDNNRPAREMVTKRVVTCSRISASKDPVLFANICKMVQSVRPEIEFRWIGDGDPSFRRILEEAGVLVSGWMTRSEALEEIASGFVYLSTSAWEGLPVSILEAMLLKIPVLCRQAEWSSPIINDGETARLFSDASAACDLLVCEDSTWHDVISEKAWYFAKENYTKKRFATDLARLYKPFDPKGWVDNP